MGEQAGPSCNRTQASFGQLAGPPDCRSGLFGAWEFESLTAHMKSEEKNQDIILQADEDGVFISEELDEPGTATWSAR